MVPFPVSSVYKGGHGSPPPAFGSGVTTLFFWPRGVLTDSDEPLISLEGIDLVPKIVDSGSRLNGTPLRLGLGRGREEDEVGCVDRGLEVVWTRCEVRAWPAGGGLSTAPLSLP